MTDDWYQSLEEIEKAIRQDIKAAKTDDDTIVDFVEESNKIEGIVRPPTMAELEATKRFLRLGKVTLSDLCEFVEICQPGARIRLEPGMNVHVGDRNAPPGGPIVQSSISNILQAVNGKASPYLTHHRYETLHPFMDGNGRSGRVLWAWMMLDQDQHISRGFLHEFYYQALRYSCSRHPVCAFQ